MRVKKWLSILTILCVLTNLPVMAEEEQDITVNGNVETMVFEVEALHTDNTEPEETPVVRSNDGDIALTEANFPDASFRNYLQTEYDEDGNGFLPEETCKWIDEIDVSDRMIASLKGIELFPNLESLNCSGNFLTSLDLSHNSLLDSLECDENMLTSLNVSQNTKLTNLSCEDNRLASLDFSKNKELESLYCSNNNLKSLNIAGFSKLKKLRCNNNQLTQLILSDNSALCTLTCYDNQLTTLDLSGFNPKIQALFTKDSIEEYEDTLQIGNDTYYVYCDSYIELTLNGKVLHPMNFKSIAFSDKEIELEVGKTYQITFITVPENMHGTVYLYWDSDCITVSDELLVTAIEEGWCTVMVETENGRYDEMEIHVIDSSVKPTKIKLNKSKVMLGVKETMPLTVIYTPKNASSKLTWSSSKPKIASVDKYGVVTGKKVGTAKITVTTANGKKDTCTITVKAAPKKVALNKKGTVTLKKGKTLKLKATLPKNTASALTWVSSKTSVATVDANGKVKAVGKGTATITVRTFNKKKATVKIKVK